MQKPITPFIMIMLLALSGCVSMKTYERSLNEAIVLNDEIIELKKQLRTQETEYRDLQDRFTALARDNAELNEILKSKKDELNTKITDLRTRLAEREEELNIKTTQLEKLSKEKEKAIAELKMTYDSLVGEMQQEIEKGEIKITRLRDKLSVSMVEQVLFDSGSAQIKRQGQKVLNRVADILHKVRDKRITVEGHTDNVPIGPALRDTFPTNWELSTARATTVTRYLQNKGVPAELLGACGYSEYQPVASNKTADGRAQNRRIEIALVPTYGKRNAADE